MQALRPDRCLLWLALLLPAQAAGGALPLIDAHSQFDRNTPPTQVIEYAAFLDERFGVPAFRAMNGRSGQGIALPALSHSGASASSPYILAFDNVWPEHWSETYVEQAKLWRRALGKLPVRRHDELQGPGRP